MDDLVFGVADLFGPSPRIEMYPVVDGETRFNTCQGTTPPGGVGLFEFQIWAKRAGAAMQGISGAEFRVTGGASFPGWFISVISPPGAASTGNPMVPVGEVHRANEAFSTCEQSPSWLTYLYTITYFGTGQSDIPADTRLQVAAGSPPSTPEFNCPLVTLCDFPAFTMVCADGGEFIINPVQLSCTIMDTPTDSPLQPQGPQGPVSWGRVKELYR